MSDCNHQWEDYGTHDTIRCSQCQIGIYDYTRSICDRIAQLEAENKKQEALAEVREHMMLEHSSGCTQCFRVIDAALAADSTP